jgi:O-antigen/teichoic acid export membrane protein
MFNYTRLAVSGAASIIITGILSSIVAYLTRIILARNLTPSEFGLFYAVFNFVLFFLFIRDLGLGQALVKYVAEFRIQGRFDDIKTAIASVFLMQFASSVFFGIIFYFLAGYLAKNYFHDPLAELILKVLVIYILTSIFFILIKQVFQGFKNMVIYSTVELVKNTLVLLIIIFFFWKDLKVMSPVIAYALVCPLLFLIYLPFLIKRFSFFRYKIVNLYDSSRLMVSFGLPVFATSIAGNVIAYIDTLILTYYRTLAEVGIYNAILPSALIFMFFSKALGTVTFPIASELWSRDDKRRLAEGIRLLHKYTFALVAPVILLVFYYSHFFITAFFGQEYASGTLAFQILLIGVLFEVVGSVNNNLISGIGRPKIVTWIVILAAASNVIINIILIPSFGINGAAIATSFSYLLMLVLSTIQIVRIVKGSYPWKDWLLLLVPAGAFLCSLFLVDKFIELDPYVEIGLGFVIALCVYTLLIYLFRLVDYGEIKYYFMVARKKEKKIQDRSP